MAYQDVILLVLGSLAAAGFGAGAAGLVAAARTRRLEREWRRDVEALRREVGALCAAASRAGDRLVALEQQVPRIQKRQEAVGSLGAARDSYRQAIALVRNGATADELMSACGLGPGEAELVSLLHVQAKENDKLAINQ